MPTSDGGGGGWGRSTPEAPAESEDGFVQLGIQRAVTQSNVQKWAMKQMDRLEWITMKAPVTNGSTLASEAECTEQAPGCAVDNGRGWRREHSCSDFNRLFVVVSLQYFGGF